MMVVTGGITAKPEGFEEAKRLSLEHAHEAAPVKIG